MHRNARANMIKGNLPEIGAGTHGPRGHLRLQYFPLLSESVMDQFTRRLVGIAVRGAQSPALMCAACSMPSMVEAHPRHLSTDHDPLA